MLDLASNNEKKISIHNPTTFLIMYRHNLNLYNQFHQFLMDCSFGSLKEKRNGRQVPSVYRYGFQGKKTLTFLLNDSIKD